MRLSILASACVPHDAISNAVIGHAELACEILGRDNVNIFSGSVERDTPCHAIKVDNSEDIKRNQFFRDSDLMLVHWGIGHPLFAIAEKKFWSRKKAIICFHNMTPAHLVEPENQDLMNRSLSQLKRLIQNKKNSFVTFSQFNRKTLQTLGVKSELIGDLAFPIEISDITSRSTVNDPLRVLSVGRMVPAKGFHTVISALKAFHALTGKNFSLKIVSSMTFGSSAYLADLMRLAKDLEIEESVTFLLDISDEALNLLYRDADFFVLDSSHEGLCVPVIEALRSDVRIITSNRGNLRHLVLYPDLTVEHSDVTGFTEAILHRYSTFESKSANRTEVIEYFSRQNVLQQLQKFFVPQRNS
jgi:glycosyltransferase involved in cell wall biosynthesis